MRRNDLRADEIMTEKAGEKPGIAANPIFALTLYAFLFSLLLPLMTKLLS